jgi:hypothetical protein
MDLPGEQLAGRRHLEESLLRPALGEPLERRNPDFNALRDWQALVQARDDHLRAEIGRDIGEFVILVQETRVSAAGRSRSLSSPMPR